MAVTVVNQWTAFPVVPTGITGQQWQLSNDDAEIATTPTPGNWLVCVIGYKMADGTAPTFSVGDYAQNQWTQLATKARVAVTDNTSDQLHAQVWVAPNVQYQGWPNLLVYVAATQITAYDSGTPVINIFELAGMTNGYLQVDSVTVASAHATTSATLSLPTPAASCVMVGAAAIDSATLTVSASGWTALTKVACPGALAGTGPNVTIAPFWRSSSTSQTFTATTVSSTNWAILGVAFRVAGTAPVQQGSLATLSNFPVVQFQLGLGYTVATPPGAIVWTDLSPRFLGMQNVRGIPYELDVAQACETTFSLANKDGMFTPRTPASATASATGTTTTMAVPSATANLNVSDFFRITNSSKVLKELSVFLVTALSTVGGTTTITFARADGTAGGASAATASGDIYVGIPIDVYIPVRVIATWAGRTYPVYVGYMERWPQAWQQYNYGIVPAVGIDTLATLVANDYTALQGEILRRNPTHYWPLNDASGASAAQNISTNSTVQLVPSLSKYGAGSGVAAFGASTQSLTFTGASVANILGDPGSGWQQSALTAVDINSHGYALVGYGTDFPPISGGVTIMGFYAVNGSVDGTIGGTGNTVNPTVVIVRNTDPGQGTSSGSVIRLSINRTGTNRWGGIVTTWDKSTYAATSSSATATQTAIPGWNTWALTFNQTSWAFHTQGAIRATGTCNLTSSFTEISVGGEVDAFGDGATFNAIHAHIAVFGRKLTQGELANIHFVGQTGSVSTITNNGTAGVIGAKLCISGWRGTRVLNTSDLVPVMDSQAANSVMDKINILAGYEDGLVFVDSAGQLQFRARVRSYYQSTVTTLGERTDLGETPYLPEVQYDYDLTYLYNNVQVTNIAIGWYPFRPLTSITTQFVAADAASVSRYGQRALTRDTQLSVPEDAWSLAYWLLGRFAYPALRIETITVDAASNPANWPTVLGIEVGDLVVLNRRPLYAPMLSANCRILQIEHDVSPGYWQTILTCGIMPGAPGGFLMTNDPVLGIVGSNVFGA